VSLASDEKTYHHPAVSGSRQAIRIV